MNSDLIKYNESLIEELKNNEDIGELDRRIMEKMLNFVVQYLGSVTKEDFEKIIDEAIK